jgi:tRNA wybutosine-synthesizing protein 2
MNEANNEKKIDSNSNHGPYLKKAKPITQHDKLREFLENHISIYNENTRWKDEWNEDLPKKWKLCQSELLILPSNCFQMSHWTTNGTSINQFYSGIANCFKVKRVAQENRVKSDDFRSPNLKLLYGEDPLVRVVNNGITYEYDITKCMFSWGNITEKLRISTFDCTDEVVVDLFAGWIFFKLFLYKKLYITFKSIFNRYWIFYSSLSR